MKEKSRLSRLMEYAGPFKYLTISSWILSAASALIGLLPFLYLWKIIQEVMAVAPHFQEAQHLVHYGWMAVFFSFLTLFVYFFALMSSHLSAFRIASNMRSRAMHHLVTLPQGFMDTFGSGKLRKMIDESSAATETYLAHQLPDKAGAIATPFGLVALLLVFDWRLGLLCLIPVVLAFLIMASMTGSKMQRKLSEYQNSLETMSNEAVEYIRGILVVKTFGQTVFSFKRFKASIDNYERWVIAYTKDMRLSMIFYTTIINSVFAVLIAAGLFFTRHSLSTSFLINLIFYIIITPVISVTLTKIMFSSENAMIVEDVLKRIDSVMDLIPLPEPSSPLHPKNASIELDKVSFQYPGATSHALHQVSLKIPAGKTVALVGPSGGGKTTLASVISRFFDVQGGVIRIGGVDIKSIAKKDLMDTVSFVFQDSRLLKLSVLENVRLGKPDASRDEVKQALNAAQCSDIIQKLPNGIDTVIGAKGVYLSGGEQQRLTIARVILKNAPIVILDEATAFADPDNESKVQAAFTELAKGKTVLMIAHRLSTVINADEIFVLDRGEVVETGTHADLLQQQGLYSKMWKDYQTSVLWKV